MEPTQASTVKLTKGAGEVAAAASAQLPLGKAAEGVDAAVDVQQLAQHGTQRAADDDAEDVRGADHVRHAHAHGGQARAAISASVYFFFIFLPKSIPATPPKSTVAAFITAPSISNLHTSLQ